MTKELSRTLSHIRLDWMALSVYQRFEALIAWVLTLVIGAVILVALYRPVIGVIETLVLRGLNPLDHSVFQRVFGEIMNATHCAGVQSQPACSTDPYTRAFLS